MFTNIICQTNNNKKMNLRESKATANELTKKWPVTMHSKATWQKLDGYDAQQISWQKADYFMLERGLALEKKSKLLFRLSLQLLCATGLMGIHFLYISCVLYISGQFLEKFVKWERLIKHKPVAHNNCRETLNRSWFFL
jgi:hypothetical protein